MSYVHVNKIKDGKIKDAVESYIKGALHNGLFEDVEKVLIKPNFVNNSSSYTGVTTDLRIVTSLIILLKELGVKEIYVGEGALEDTEEVFKSLEIYQLEEYGAKIINFERDELIRVDSPSGLALSRFHLPKTVMDCDLIISVAKMKTHSDTGATLSMKNLLGCIPKKERRIGHIAGIDETIVDVFSYLISEKRFISIVDAIHALEGKLGPIQGNPINMDLLVAGNDPVAVDAASVRIMGYNPKKVKHIAIADKLGLGEIENWEVRGEDIDEVKVDFEMPPTLPSFKSYLFTYAMEKFFKKIPNLECEDKCTGCGKCASSCPIENIEIKNGKVNIDSNKCIGCMVCIEACREGALDYRINHEKIYAIGRWIYHKIPK